MTSLLQVLLGQVTAWSQKLTCEATLREGRHTLLEIKSMVNGQWIRHGYRRHDHRLILKLDTSCMTDQLSNRPNSRKSRGAFELRSRGNACVDRALL
jgi:hypothetical protein